MSWSGFLSSVTDVTGVKVSEEGLKGFASYLTDHAKAAVNTLESTISSTVDTAQEYIEETRRVFDDEREEKQLQQAMQEALQRADKVPPWHIWDEHHCILEDELKQQCMQVSEDDDNFISAPPPSFTEVFCLDDYIPVTLQAFQTDHALSKRHARYVPKIMNEIEFFQRYYYHISLVRMEVGVGPLLDKEAIARQKSSIRARMQKEIRDKKKKREQEREKRGGDSDSGAGSDGGNGETDLRGSERKQREGRTGGGGRSDGQINGSSDGGGVLMDEKDLLDIDLDADLNININLDLNIENIDIGNMDMDMDMDQIGDLDIDIGNIDGRGDCGVEGGGSSRGSENHDGSGDDRGDRDGGSHGNDNGLKNDQMERGENDVDCGNDDDDTSSGAKSNDQSNKFSTSSGEAGNGSKEVDGGGIDERSNKHDDIDTENTVEKDSSAVGSDDGNDGGDGGDDGDEELGLDDLEAMLANVDVSVDDMGIGVSDDMQVNDETIDLDEMLNGW